MTPDNVVHRMVKGCAYVFMREPVGRTDLNKPGVLDRILGDIEDSFDGGCPADCKRGA